MVSLQTIEYWGQVVLGRGILSLPVAGYRYHEIALGVKILGALVGNPPVLHFEIQFRKAGNTVARLQHIVRNYGSVDTPKSQISALPDFNDAGYVVQNEKINWQPGHPVALTNWPNSETLVPYTVNGEFDELGVVVVNNFQAGTNLFLTLLCLSREEGVLP